MVVTLGDDVSPYFPDTSAREQNPVSGSGQGVNGGSRGLGKPDLGVQNPNLRNINKSLNVRVGGSKLSCDFIYDRDATAYWRISCTSQTHMVNSPDYSFKNTSLPACLCINIDELQKEELELLYKCLMRTCTEARNNSSEISPYLDILFIKLMTVVQKLKSQKNSIFEITKTNEWQEAVNAYCQFVFDSFQDNPKKLDVLKVVALTMACQEFSEHIDFMKSSANLRRLNKTIKPQMTSRKKNKSGGLGEFALCLNVLKELLEKTQMEIIRNRELNNRFPPNQNPSLDERKNSVVSTASSSSEDFFGAKLDVDSPEPRFSLPTVDMLDNYFKAELINTHSGLQSHCTCYVEDYYTLFMQKNLTLENNTDSEITPFHHDYLPLVLMVDVTKLSDSELVAYFKRLSKNAEESLIHFDYPVSWEYILEKLSISLNVMQESEQNNGAQQDLLRPILRELFKKLISENFFKGNKLDSSLKIAVFEDALCDVTYARIKINYRVLVHLKSELESQQGALQRIENIGESEKILLDFVNHLLRLLPVYIQETIDNNKKSVPSELSRWQKFMRPVADRRSRRLTTRHKGEDLNAASSKSLWKVIKEIQVTDNIPKVNIVCNTESCAAVTFELNNQDGSFLREKLSDEDLNSVLCVDVDKLNDQELWAAYCRLMLTIEEYLSLHEPPCDILADLFAKLSSLYSRAYSQNKFHPTAKQFYDKHRDIFLSYINVISQQERKYTLNELAVVYQNWQNFYWDKTLVSEVGALHRFLQAAKQNINEDPADDKYQKVLSHCEGLISDPPVCILPDEIHPWFDGLFVKTPALHLILHPCSDVNTAAWVDAYTVWRQQNSGDLSKLYPSDYSPCSIRVGKLGNDQNETFYEMMLNKIEEDKSAIMKDRNTRILIIKLLQMTPLIQNEDLKNHCKSIVKRVVNETINKGSVNDPEVIAIIMAAANLIEYKTDDLLKIKTMLEESKSQENLNKCKDNFADGINVALLRIEGKLKK